MTKRDALSVRLNEAGIGNEATGEIAAKSSIRLVKPSVIRLDREKAALVYSTTQIEDADAGQLLDRFVKLGEATDQQILKFAMRYGVLSFADTIGGAETQSETLEHWRNLVNRVRATLRIAADLRDGRNPEEPTWNALRPWWNEGWRGMFGRRSTVGSKDKRSGWEQAQFRDVLNAWVRFADLRPVVVSVPNVQLRLSDMSGVFAGRESLPAALVLQLLTAVADARGLATCSECAALVFTTRKPAVGRRTYCENCKTAASRHAQAKRRAGVAVPRKNSGKGRA